MDTIRETALGLVVGAYDLHTHNAPSHFKRAVDSFQVLREADKFGMAGILIKGHYECTADAAFLTNKYAGTQAKAYPSVALNCPQGGINPYAVEAAAKKGVRYVWMPTLDAENSTSFGRLPIDFYDREGISAFDENGKLKRQVYEVMEVVKKHNIYLATGHMSAKESIAVCKAGCEMGVNMILTHPDWERTIVPLEQQCEMARAGVLVEKVWFNIACGNISTKAMADSIKELGADSVFMVTDRGQYGFELPPTAMVNFIEAMLKEGIPEKDIVTMVRVNPKRIVEG